MKPFNSVEQAMVWISKHAKEAVEVMVHDESYIMGGKPWNGVEVPPTSLTADGWCFW